jgi:hypothetical protein
MMLRRPTDVMAAMAHKIEAARALETTFAPNRKSERRKIEAAASRNPMPLRRVMGSPRKRMATRAVMTKLIR